MVLINLSVAEVSPGFAAGYPIPMGSMVLLYMITFTINIPHMLAYVPYMDPMGYITGQQKRCPMDSMDPAVSERKCDVRGMMTSSSGGQAPYLRQWAWSPNDP